MNSNSKASIDDKNVNVKYCCSFLSNVATLINLKVSDIKNRDTDNQYMFDQKECKKLIDWLSSLGNEFNFVANDLKRGMK